ncbi:MAG: glutamine amidotransferase [Gammaproteobacteria bacterium]|nr:glutamine amidotransferase [Gammaproteobacteria bacterium]
MNDPPAPVQVIRHLCFEGLGTLANELDRLGLAFDYLDPPSDGVAAARDAEVLIVMGGPISVNDADRFPFLRDEIEAIRHRIDGRLPTLGICLGAQLIARAMAARIVPMVAPEIGWQSLDLTTRAQAGPLRHLTTPVLHWHGETFDLPPGAEGLASTAACPNQAFAAADHTLALQFHIEVSAAHLEHWLVGHIHELDHSGIGVDELRDDARRFAANATASGGRILAEWLAGNGIGPRDRTH